MTAGPASAVGSLDSTPAVADRDPFATAPQFSTPERVRVRALGRTSYDRCWRAMQEFTAARDRASDDEIWLTEHDPVFTLGLAGRPEHVHDTAGIPLVKVDRGGQVTYHGPGQLLAYLLFDLRRSGMGVRDMVRAIESAVIDFVATLGIAAYAKRSAPGVYVHGEAGEAKLAALGLKVRNGCTYHGLTLNVDMDLAPFLAIDPCGYPGLAVTSLRALGAELDVRAAGIALAPRLAVRLSGNPLR